MCHLFLHLSLILSLLTFGCDPGRVAPGELMQPVRFPVRGAWLASRQGFPLDSEQALGTLSQLKALGVNRVAIGIEVSMPKVTSPDLVWGNRDQRLRTVLGRIRRAGLSAFLMPRIESPDFFVPPYPFRADIGFVDQADWDEFHRQMQRMLLHYAVLAEEERVDLFGIGLELKQSVRGHERAWRKIIAALRRVYSGKLTYSANWYDEWEQVPFWDALDYVGIGAYFELHPEDGLADAEPVEDLIARWQPIRSRLSSMAHRLQRSVLFTEIGYTGYADCAERPWEWAGKEAKDVPIDLSRQADCYEAVLSTFGREEWMQGIFVWRFYTDSRYVEDREYGLQGRPSAEVLGRAYRQR